MKNYLLKILRWYFSKQALPYWCLMLTDFAIIFISAVVTFWLFEKSQHLFDQRIDVFFTALVYALLPSSGQGRSVPIRGWCAIRRLWT